MTDTFSESKNTNTNTQSSNPMINANEGEVMGVNPALSPIKLDSSLDKSLDKVSAKPPSLIYGSSMIACICIGAGMLGLPTAGAGAWTVWSLLLLLIAMLAMTASGCFILEVLQTYRYRVSIASITKDVLGPHVALATNIAVYLVGGALLYAYTTSSGLMISEMAGINPQWASILFVAICSVSVWYSSLLVSRLSVVLILFVLISFFLITTDIIGNVQIDTLLQVDLPISTQAMYSLSLFPIALASFGYHHNVSTLRDMYGNERQAEKAIIGGTIMAYIIYSIWLIAVFGTLARSDFINILAVGGNVDVLLAALSSAIQKPLVTDLITAFTASAILSSFICVGRGVFDYLADLFHFDNSKMGRAKTLAVTFVPPLIGSLLMPFGFLVALGFAASAAAFWACIVPASLVWKTRRNQRLASNPSPNQSKNYKVYGGQWVLFGVFAFGVVVIVTHVLSFTTLLPRFGV